MQIKDLKDGQKKVDIKAKVVEVGTPREVKSTFKDETYKVADAVIADESGSIKLTLWNEQIDKIKVADNIEVKNGYVTTFKGEIQLNVGKFGTLSITL